MKKNHNIFIQLTRGGRGILALLACLAVGSCNCSKGKIGTLKMKIVPPAGDFKRFESATQLDLEVIEGHDKTENYKIQIARMQSFYSMDWTGPEVVDDAEKTKLVEPGDGKNLNEILNTKELTKGDKAKLYCKFLFKDGPSRGFSASADIAIVDKQGNIVGGPIMVRWTMKT
jgi:hypothetical protein